MHNQRHEGHCSKGYDQTDDQMKDQSDPAEAEEEDWNNRYQSWSGAADQKVPQKSSNKVPITPFVKAR